MGKDTVLIVDDEPSIRELLRISLEREGFQILEAEDGEQGLDIAKRENPSLVILDIMLPGKDGLETCKALKSGLVTCHIPIMMITALGDETDIVVGLELGADDYLTKPFSPRVLRARAKALLRRGRPRNGNANDPISIHDLVINPGRFEVMVGDCEVLLSPTEFRVLIFLASQPGWVFTRYQIVDAVKGSDCAVTDRSVDVQIVSLRKKLLHAGTYIETVRGVGYRFKE